MLSCFVPDGEVLKEGCTAINKHLAPHTLRIPEGQEDEHQAEVPLLDWYVLKVDEPQEGVFRIHLFDGSWVVFYRDDKKASIYFGPKHFQELAKHFAVLMMAGANWYTGPQHILDITEAGEAPAAGPVIQPVPEKKKNNKAATTSFEPELETQGNNKKEDETPAPKEIVPSVIADPVLPLSQEKPILRKSYAEPENERGANHSVAEENGNPFLNPSVASPESIKKNSETAWPTPVEQKRAQAANKVLAWAKEYAPGLLVGSLAGTGVRMGAQFALAAIATTLPGFAVAMAAAPIASTIVSAVAVGAVAGGVSKLIVTSLFGKEKKKEKNWRRKAFVTGALSGTLGGMVGLGIADLIKTDGLLHHLLFGEQSVPIPATTAVVMPEPISPDLTPNLEQGSNVIPESQGAASLSEQNLPDVSLPTLSQAPVDEALVTALPKTPDVAPLTTAMSESGLVEQISIKALLSEEQLQSMPSHLQKLAASDNPKDIIVFCKEASFRLINVSERNGESFKVASKLIERGLEIAHKADIHTPTVEKLSADMAYLKAWGLGIEKSIPEAIEYAKQSGIAVHNYAGRLLKILRVPVQA